MQGLEEERTIGMETEIESFETKYSKFRKSLLDQSGIFYRRIPKPLPRVLIFPLAPLFPRMLTSDAPRKLHPAFGAPLRVHSRDSVRVCAYRESICPVRRRWPWNGTRYRESLVGLDRLWNTKGWALGGPGQRGRNSWRMRERWRPLEWEEGI